MKNQETHTEFQQQIPEIAPEDGQTENLPELQAETIPEMAEVGLPEFSTEMMTNSGETYSREEFRQNFNSFLEFLENPATATDTFGQVVGKGRELSADKIYNLAERYDWLKWLIDRKTQVFGDLLLVTVFLTFESNVIIQNWTGISYIERLKIWLKNKAQERKQAIKSGQRRSLFGWVFSGRPAAEKATVQNN